MKGTAAIVATVVCLGVLADTWTDPETGVEWTYTVLDGEASLGGSGSQTAITNDPTGVLSIPAALGGCPVTGVGDWAFRNLRMARVDFPESVRNIGSGAFYLCTNLVSVTLPQGVTTIGQYAFEKCRGLTSVTVPRSLAYVEMHAFSDCINLAAVYITDVADWCRITFEGAGANPLYCGPALYLDGSAITYLAIPDSITEIKDNAFHGCGGLVGVTIHDGVVGIGASVFESCGELRSVRLPNGMTSIGSALFRNCGALAEVTIPRCVTSIEGYAFQGCGEIASVTIPRGVTYIGDYAFEGCRSLTNVVFMGNAPTVAWWSSGLIPSAFNGVGESCEVYVSKMSTGWGVSVGDEWLGMTLRYWPELLTPVDSIAAARGIVSEFADERVAACVESLDDYAQLAAWAGEKGIYQPELKDSSHAWSSFALGAMELLENEPGIDLGDVSVAAGQGVGSSMSVSVVVKDGDRTVSADSAKVAAMFEATGDLADWTGSALAPNVKCIGVYDGVMHFAVGLGDVPNGRAFLRIRNEP